ncbi:MAG: polysaccharide export protein [Hyphomicrobiaceae bacterium]|nr:polysaccharide export protein [Hyphomicrobiaceae bacterium]
MLWHRWTRWWGCLPASLITCAAILLSGCATGSTLPELDISKSNVGVNDVYRLGVGDKLKINVFGEADLSGNYEVDAGGRISFPLIGALSAAGQTVPKFREALRRKLADGYLKRPRLTVDVTNYRPVYVLGEVRSPGEHAFRAGMKLRDIIAIAGGYTYRADEAYVILNRTSLGRAVRVPASSAFYVLPGDNIRVPERFF